MMPGKYRGALRLDSRKMDVYAVSEGYTVLRAICREAAFKICCTIRATKAFSFSACYWQTVIKRKTQYLLIKGPINHVI